MKVYISGPMSGITNQNRDAFFDAQQKIVSSGNVPINPAILPDGLTQPEYMQICMSMMMVADSVWLLDGWSYSKGALAEVALAEKLGLTFLKLGKC